MKKAILVFLGILVIASFTGCKKMPENVETTALNEKKEESVKEELQGTVIELSERFESKILNNSRKLIIYLPPSYESSDKKYPVIYAHDGQNLFNKNSGGSPTRWDADKTINKLITEDLIEEVIVVGIYNTSARIDEYTPIYNNYYKAGGKGDEYLQFIIEELKPYIDQNYRTLTDASNTAIMGSSLGGLISFYAGYRYPDTFGKIIAISPSFFWHDASDMDPIFRNNNRYMINEVANNEKPKQTSKMWIDIGTNEEQDDRDNDGLADAIDDTRDMVNTLIQKGYAYKADFLYYEHNRGIHSEVDWKTRLFMPLIYMFGKQPLVEQEMQIACPDKVIKGKIFYPSTQIIYNNGVESTITGLSLNSSDLEINNEGACISKKTGTVVITASYNGFDASKTIEIVDIAK